MICIQLVAVREALLPNRCSMFAEYCSTPFDIEAVKVINADGSDFISPDMDLVPFEVTDPHCHPLYTQFCLLTKLCSGVRSCAVV